MSTVLVTEGPDEGLVWHHGNPVAEQRAMVDGTGLARLGTPDAPGRRGVLTVSGPDRLTWLHALTSQHLSDLTPGSAVTTLVLTPQGHVEHVLHGVDDGETFTAWTEPGKVGDLLAWLQSMVFFSRVELADRSDDLDLVWAGHQVALPDDVVALDSPLGGSEVFWPRDRELPDHTPVGTWALEAARIAAGRPRIFVDTDHRTIPNEIGLLGTHLDKGCYRGQETVARVHTLGRPPRRLTLLHLDGSMDALPPLGAEVTLDGRAVGRMGSSARHHELGPIGLALLKRSVPTDAQVTVASAHGEPIAAAQEILVDPEVGLHVRPRLG